VNNEATALVENIQRQIYAIRGLHVMLDADLAELYGVQTKVLNQAVKRNSDRFPPEFMFQLSEAELEILRSQNVTSRWGGRRYTPYAFTEQGVAMLSAVLRSDTAVAVSIHIMNAFVAMRRFVQSNTRLFQRLDLLELKQLETDQKIAKVLSVIENNAISPKQGIFFEGQVFDAWRFVSELIRSAKKSLVLIDNYIDDSVLSLFCKREKSVAVTILTKNITARLEVDVEKFNAQYPPLILEQFNASHDRFLIIDETDLYHFGASLKDLGKKWFAFSKMDMGAVEMLKRVDAIVSRTSDSLSRMQA
jgi:hypothetical protein